VCFIRNTVDVNAQMVGNASADVFRGKAFFHSRICWLDVKLPMVMTRPPVVEPLDPTQQYALQCGAISTIVRVLQLHHSFRTRREIGAPSDAGRFTFFANLQGRRLMNYGIDLADQYRQNLSAPELSRQPAAQRRKRARSASM
jgi:hypothetical protein